MEQMQDKYPEHYAMHGFLIDEIPEKPIVREPVIVRSDAAYRLTAYFKKVASTLHNKIVLPGGRVIWQEKILN